MALSVPLSRFTSRVGGGSAFFVSRHSHAMPPIAYLKTDCEHCSGHIEYPSELAGQSIECPHCQQTTALPSPFTPPPAAPVQAPPQTKRQSPLNVESWQVYNAATTPQLPPRGGEICETCGSVGHAVTRTEGSFAIELVLWLLFCFPGIIYSVWRLASRKKVCGQCGGKMISVGTPRGQQLWNTYHH